MTEKGPTVSAKQLAMSRALGAAFLTHQVEQLEKTVVNSRGPAAPAPAAAASSNWRERRYQTGGLYNYRAPPTPHPQGNKPGSKRPPPTAVTPSAGAAARSAPVAAKTTMTTAKGRDSPVFRRKSSDEERDRGENIKDADIVVVDASVLVHALYQVKRWCKDGREEIIIVPLEALNTLDLLKKGTTSLAQRARAASRILEAQVGTNPRIRVQQDDAFVYWDKITFVSEQEAPVNENDTVVKSLSTSPYSSPPPPPSPEWVRRTVCCAKWEVENSLATLSLSHSIGNRTNTNTTTAATSTTNSDNESGPHPRVVLAILAPSASSPSSPQLGQLKLSEGGEPVPVVPLPAPNHPHSHANPHGHGNKFEPRSSGTLVSYWAAKAGIDVVEVDATAPGHGRGGGGKEREREDDYEEVLPPSRGGGRKGHYGGGRGGHGRRKPSFSVSEGGGTGPQQQESSAGFTGLVERPPAVMAMMEMVSHQPNKGGRVVRVLARGEKLDP